MKVSECFQPYELHLKSMNRAESTILSYLVTIKMFGCYLKKRGVEEIEDVTRNMVSDYQVSLCTKNEYNGKVLSIKRQVIIMIVVKGFFNFLHKRGFLDLNPASHIELARYPKSLPKVILTRREILKLLRVPDENDVLGLRDKAMMELLYSTGIRSLEIRRLNLHDIDFSSGFIKVLGKGSKERIVPFGEVASWYIQEYLQKSRPKLMIKDTDKVFLSRRGRAMTGVTLNNNVKKYVRQSGIEKNINIHTFSHKITSNSKNHNSNNQIDQSAIPFHNIHLSHTKKRN